tara:strand:+ start:35818 stop:36921 length:1104 start_codon:yes stop_codon:yes gene_type:complete
MFFINNYSFYSTHRKELIEFLSDYKRMFVVCNMKGNKDKFNRVSFIDTNFSDASFSLINILKDTYLSFRVLFKSKEHINFFVSPRIILLGILNSFLFRKKKFIYIFSGFGYLFINQTLSSQLIRAVYMLLLRSSVFFNKSECIVQNKDDYEFLKNSGINKKHIKIIHGNGLNHKNFVNSNNSKNLSIVKFLFVGRLLKDKGLIEFLESSKEIIKAYQGQILIGVAGSSDKNNPASLNQENLKKEYDFEEINFFGDLSQSEVMDLYAEYNVFVLPSYREGLPRSAIEASLSGMPLILSDVPGCRECLEEGKNGFFVRDRSAKEILKKMKYFVQNKEKINQMGTYSRKMAIKKFSGDKIFNEYLAIIKE